MSCGGLGRGVDKGGDQEADPRAGSWLPRPRQPQTRRGANGLGLLCALSSRLWFVPKAPTDSSLGPYAESSWTSQAWGFWGSHCPRRASRIEHPGERECPTPLPAPGSPLHPTSLFSPDVPRPLCVVCALPLGCRHPPHPCTPSVPQTAQGECGVQGKGGIKSGSSHPLPQQTVLSTRAGSLPPVSARPRRGFLAFFFLPPQDFIY